MSCSSSFLCSAAIVSDVNVPRYAITSEKVLQEQFARCFVVDMIVSKAVALRMMSFCDERRLPGGVALIAAALE